MSRPTPLPPPSQMDWKVELQQAIRSAEELATEGFIDPKSVPSYERLLQKFPLVLPRYYARLIDRADPFCPIRLQAVPQLRELDDGPGFEPDPLGDLEHQPVPRITHRYANRVLIHLTPNCSLVCRYCFRKSLLGEKRAEFFEGQLAPGLDYIRATPQIEEVIFSGGDPFLAAEMTLAQALKGLSEIPHVRRVRFHSRVPATLPMRITPDFADRLLASRRPTVVVTHFNHPKEVTVEARTALGALAGAGLRLLNQSVLLKGVNDDALVLKRLSEALFEAGALPYYLHHPDRARGTAHFDLPPSRGLEIYRELRSSTSGYLVPRYVVDNPALPFKRDVADLSELFS